MQSCEITEVLRLIQQWITGIPSQKTFLQLGQATGSCSHKEVEAIAENIPVDHLTLDTFCSSPGAAKGKICLENLKEFSGKNPKLDSFVNAFVNRMEPPKKEARFEPPKEEIKSQVLLPSVSPERELSLALTSPLMNFDSDTTLWYSATQLLGKFTDFLGKNGHLDESMEGRLSLSLFTLYYQWAATFYSHELAHRHQAYKYGGLLGSVNFLDWWPQLVPGWRHPSNSEIRKNLSDYEHQLDTLGGLNQQEFNASYQFHKNSVRGAFTPDEGVAYIFNNFADLAYQLGFGTWLNGDINQFIMHTRSNDARIDPGQLMFWSLITALASYHSWESALTFADYLMKGDRSPRELARLKIGDFELIPPHISLFPHPLGLFTNVELPVRHLLGKDSATFFSVGFGTGGKLDLIRLGVECVQLRLTSSQEWYIPRLGLFGALNFHTIDAEKLLNGAPPQVLSPEEFKNVIIDDGEEKSARYYSVVDEKGRPLYYLKVEELQNFISYTTGFEVGARVQIGTDVLNLTATLAYSSNDFIQNGIKGKPSGLEWNLAASWRF